jgi:hypothetical protein
MALIEFLNDIPSIPEELLTYDINDIINSPIIYQGARTAETAGKGIYSTHDVSDELYSFLRPHFGDNIEVRYQLFKSQIPVHIDAHVLSGVTHVYNYVLLTGGENIKTRHWKVPDEDKLIYMKDRPRTVMWGDELNNEQLLNEAILPTKRWHKLAVNMPHDISKIDSPRLGITVFNRNGIGSYV